MMNSFYPIITSGSYTGNDVQNRAIPHKLGVIPKLVIITRRLGLRYFVINGGNPSEVISVAQAWTGVTAMDRTAFYVGDSPSTIECANYLNVPYDWVAFA